MTIGFRFESEKSVEMVLMNMEPVEMVHMNMEPVEMVLLNRSDVVDLAHLLDAHDQDLLTLSAKSLNCTEHMVGVSKPKKVRIYCQFPPLLQR
ncbi:hypothetical protein Ccrd_025490 [Cynara cardunculus var. scolymus]|uniref:Uncharacterized protein n=1 Tax=Cynara cardunculus var. scolymus TaxID=59895 RepID=A0A118JML4_CYNCS|nr:hypothetical protein Ccrd_025490 [Cynara cardunculus var. scolymus]